MLLGILAGLTTCALWGLTFVAPRLVAPFTTWDLTVARYGLFGVTSLALMLHPRFRPASMSRGQIVTGLLLGALAALVYFVSAAYAVRLAGAAIPPLVVGLAPVLLAIAANRRDNSLPWRLLAWPLGLILVGLLVVNIGVIRSAAPDGSSTVLLGVGLSMLALAAWVGFGWVNATVMQASDAPDGLQWTGLQGLGAGVGAILLLPMTSFDPNGLTTVAERMNFWSWVVLMGIMGSWIATWCWVFASRKLPLALLSQLIVAETIFGLLYGFLYEHRLPTVAEGLGSVLQLSGVIVAIAMFGRLGRSSTLRSSVQPTGEATRPVSP